MIVLVVTGLLLSVAYHQVVAGAPQNTRARADLLADIRARGGEADQLQRSADTLREQVARDAESAADDGADDVARSLAAATGLGPVVGDGVSVRLVDGPPRVDPVTGRASDDNPGLVVDRDLQDLINTLWRYGAEAVAINGQRLASGTTIRTAGGAILVNFRPVASPYEILAIGPGDLADQFSDSSTAQRFGRYRDAYRMTFDVRPRNQLHLAAVSEPRLRFAQPTGDASGASGSPSSSDRSRPSSPGPARSSPAGSVRSATGGTS